MSADPDAFELLRKVADAYRALTTLDVEAVAVSESGDDDASSRSEQRCRFRYRAPNRVRFEGGGRSGMLQVADGADVHTVFRRAHGNERVARVRSLPIARMPFLPHAFRPDFPVGSDGAFLFSSIDEGVLSARIVGEEDGCSVVEAAYERPAHSGVAFRGVQFRVDLKNLMVMRQEGELGHRFPTEEEVMWTRHSMSVTRIRVNEGIDEDVFRFAPPPDTMLSEAGGCGISIGGGSGFIQGGPDERTRLEHRGSHEWEGGTLVEHSRWKIRGITLQFERRLAFSDGDTEVNIEERIEGGEAEAKGSFRIRLK